MLGKTDFFLDKECTSRATFSDFKRVIAGEAGMATIFVKNIGPTIIEDAKATSSRDDVKIVNDFKSEFKPGEIWELKLIWKPDINANEKKMSEEDFLQILGLSVPID